MKPIRSAKILDGGMTKRMNTIRDEIYVQESDVCQITNGGREERYGKLPC
jgi:hypothetical protein